ncbi:myeloid differentiation primary response protein MyD88 [Schistocerca serialis cubense]|uniref:myeloid differentiation primary response protein MyD88 n=1 Tax=Schistocerca serialis cubense TaxID=2023355 RepID=UPI00214EAD81|nr:myeloid differentiation primary response protein MyD88 [Schistocerca serialis cubense]
MAGFEEPDLFQVSIKALKPSTQDMVCSLLNPLKVIPTDEGLPRDWRGLAQLVGLHGEKIPQVSSNPNPTEQVLKQWQENSIGLLQKYLGELDRWDIVDDTEVLMKNDAIEYLKSVERASSSASVLDVETDKQILTRDDVIRAEKGLKPQTYSAFLLYADEDENFAMQVVDQMETKYKLKLCLRDRDLIGGLAFEHEAIMRLISERCNRLIVVVSPSFLKSEANKFFVTFAQALGIDQKHRKVVPVLYQKCQLPPELSYYFLLDFTRPGHLWNFWEKLHDSIAAPSANSRTTRDFSRTEEVTIKNNIDDKFKEPTASGLPYHSAPHDIHGSALYKPRSLKDIPSDSLFTPVKQHTSSDGKRLKKSKSPSLENLKPKAWLKRFLPSSSHKKKGSKVAEGYEC